MPVVSPWYQLGYVIPHLYTDVDSYQFYKVAPDGVMLVTTQMNLREYSVQAVEEELPAFWRGVDVLASKRVNRISLSGVPVAASLGRSRMSALLEEVSARTAITADNDLEAHVAALHHLGVSRVALATRWPEHLTEAVAAYLAEANLEVVSSRSRQRDLGENKRAKPGDDHELALELGRLTLSDAPSAEALLLPGGLWFAVHAAPMLEAEFGVPVLLNITSTLWAALHNWDGKLPQRPDPRWGKLLATLD